MNVAAEIRRLREQPPEVIDRRVAELLRGATKSKRLLDERAQLVTALSDAHLWPPTRRNVVRP